MAEGAGRIEETVAGIRARQAAIERGVAPGGEDRPAMLATLDTRSTPMSPRSAG